MVKFYLLLLLIIISNDVSGQRKVITPICKTTDDLETEAICSSFPDKRIPLNVKSMKVNKCDEKLTYNVISFGSHIEKLNFSDCGLHLLDTPIIDSNTNVVDLDLSHNYIESIKKSSFDENLSLKILNLNGNRIQSIENGSFINLINLESLFLARNQLITIPINLPQTLKVLELNINNIVEFDANMKQESLIKLNLCDNHLEYIPESEGIHLPNVEELCLGNLTISLPLKFQTYFPRLNQFYLHSSRDHHTTIKSSTAEAISECHSLTLLSISNYGIETLSFLKDLTMLTIVVLENVTLEYKEGDLSFGPLNDKNIAVLYLDGSTDIVRQLIENHEKLRFFTESLHSLSLRNTGITHLPENFMPIKSHFKVDISDNPLHCDCSLIQSNPSLIKFLVHAEETKCNTPQEQSIIQFFGSEDCNTQSSLLPPYQQESTTEESNTQSSLLPPYQQKSTTDSSNVYIITGILIGILVLIGLVLLVVYMYIKKRNAVAPAEMVVTQSMQQIRQASSADQLLER